MQYNCESTCSFLTNYIRRHNYQWRKIMSSDLLIIKGVWSRPPNLLSQRTRKYNSHSREYNNFLWGTIVFFTRTLHHNTRTYFTVTPFSILRFCFLKLKMNFNALNFLPPKLALRFWYIKRIFLRSQLFEQMGKISLFILATCMDFFFL